MPDEYYQKVELVLVGLGEHSKMCFPLSTNTYTPDQLNLYPSGKAAATLT